MKLKLQKLRAGTEHESYRIAIPKAVIQAHKWENVEFEISVEKNKITLTPSKNTKN